MRGDSEVSLVAAYRSEKDPKVRERILIITLLEEGKSTYEAASTLHCSQSKAAYWKKRYEEEGLAGLRTRKQPGKPPKVPKEKMEEVRRILEEGEWWTAKTVRELIHEKSGVLYSERHIQAPARVGIRLGEAEQEAHKQSEQEGGGELQKKAKRALLEAKRKGWSVVCEDESIVVYDSVVRAVWAKKGSKPTILTTGSHARTCIFGALSADGGQLFRQHPKVNGENLLRFQRETKRKFKRFVPFISQSPTGGTKG